MGWVSVRVSVCLFAGHFNPQPQHRTCFGPLALCGIAKRCSSAFLNTLPVVLALL
jgi:hypothetical protein